jgi:uncharacterized protein YlxW (UPF0749 family)
LNDEKAKREMLSKTLDEHEKRRENYMKSFLESSNNRKLEYDFNNAKIMAGLTDVKGAGIIIKMNDASLKLNVPSQFQLIHDNDITTVLNELKKAGAQAISINGERLMATSEQLCAGPTVRINKNRYAVPYEIKAIGDPDILYRELEKSTIITDMRDFEIKIEISKQKEIVIPKYGNNSGNNINNILNMLEVVGK